MENKKWLLVILSICPLFAWSWGESFSTETQKLDRTQVITMNVHCFEEDWEFRFKHILDQIIKMNPDIVALQEVCVDPKGSGDQIDFIKNYLKHKNFSASNLVTQYTHRAWDRYDEYLLMFSRLPAQVLDHGLLPPSLLQRGFIGLQIQGVWYLSTHLEYRADNASYRAEQIDFLINRYKNQSMVLMGDFNSAPDSWEQSQLLQLQYSPFFPGPTFLGGDGNASNKIDGFWISHKKTNRSHYAEVILNSKVNEKRLSDHFGVRLFLIL